MNAEPQMVTANRLIDGVVVYMKADKDWSEHFVDGAVWPDKESADSALIASEEAVKARLVVGPYLFDVALTDAGPKPVSARERIRATHLPTFEPEVGSWTGRISD
ncbi:MAG TPA: DUF2849 domain-containing protein [Dongiaceae bacterium]|nr:DUF2849 domain-containing protein [Dongiaceae bacterium]